MNAMPPKSIDLRVSANSYDSATIAFHWLTAVFVLLQWCGAISMDLIDQRPFRMVYWTVHIVLGVALFGLIAARLIWRQFGGRALEPAGGRTLRILTKTVHRLLYVLILALVACGLSIVATRGWTLLGLFTIPSTIPGQYSLSRELVQIHGWIAHTLVAVASGHAAVALYHHWRLRDGIMQRML